MSWQHLEIISFFQSYFYLVDFIQFICDFGIQPILNQFLVVGSFVLADVQPRQAVRHSGRHDWSLCLELQQEDAITGTITILVFSGPCLALLCLYGLIFISSL